MRKVVLVVGDGSAYYEPFAKFGSLGRDLGLFRSPNNIALVVFTGGADISPSLYGEKPSRTTYNIPHRDIYEMTAFRQALKLGLPMAGICRGAQFLCAMAGGKLVQDVTGHGCYHDMRTWDDRTMRVSSTHHQMMLPPPDAKLLGWALPRLSKQYIGALDMELDPPKHENETVYFPNIRAIGMQYHPEMMQQTSQGFKFCEEIVDTFLLRR